jgi:methylmalonyl-CoA/ethylmalonyl-CoA epimerase
MNDNHVTGIDHIGIAVRDLENAIEKYTALLGTEPAGEDVVKSEKVRICFFNVGTVRIELLEGLDEDSPISRYIDRNGPGIHHIALGVDNLEETVERLKNAGFRMIEPLIRAGAHGSKIAFAHPKSTEGLLIELCQKS